MGKVEEKEIRIEVAKKTELASYTAPIETRYSQTSVDCGPASALVARVSGVAPSFGRSQ